MLTSIVSSLTTAITTLLSGLGTGIVDCFEAIFMNAEGTALSSFGIFAIVLMGIGIALGIFSWIRHLMGR